jgi:transposase
MDTSTLAVERAPRLFRSLEEKLRVIAEARVPGASVAAVARKHGMNANLLFAWMRQQDQGVLTARTRGRPKLLAVTVAPDAATGALRESKAVAPAAPPTEQLDITLPDGTWIRATGAVPMERLEQLVRLLRR